MNKKQVIEKIGKENLKDSCLTKQNFLGINYYYWFLDHMSQEDKDDISKINFCKPSSSEGLVENACEDKNKEFTNRYLHVKSNESGSSGEGSGRIVKESERDLCYYNKALQSNNFNYCLQISACSYELYKIDAYTVSQTDLGESCVTNLGKDKKLYPLNGFETK